MTGWWTPSITTATRPTSAPPEEFTAAPAKTVHAPVIQEAFLTLECTLKEVRDLSGAGITAMVIGQVQHISVEEDYAQGYESAAARTALCCWCPHPRIW